MTVGSVYEDLRKPMMPYAVTIRYGRTMSLVETHRFPTRTMAEEAAAQIRTHGLDTSPWPSHFRASGNACIACWARALLAENRQRRSAMADPVPAGSDVSAGTYKCTSCGYELEVGSTKNLPPCPSCHNGQWDTLSGGDSKDD